MAKQKFKFADLYRNNRSAVEQTLLSMWCGETKNDSQRAYAAQLRRIIAKAFAPEEAVPLVQCMNAYKSVFSVSKEEANAIVGGLWKKSLKPGDDYPPYEHQYECWDTLLNRKTDTGQLKSICVTTGTGSGKTECFMMPLVHDLMEQNGPQRIEQVQAIFLYPLNALMEDQKERLEKLLEGTELYYAVYNGELPNDIPSADDPNYEKVMRRIDSIRGVERDDQGREVSVKYKHAIATRMELRRHPANILLTNPTMLEYILLRNADNNLIQPDAHSLRWIAIDETHTYTGAGAAELAMLLRRVLMAYDVTTETVRFATSSATIGGSASGDAKQELQKFIADMTGLQVGQVEVVTGEREGITHIPHDEDEAYWKKLIGNDKNDGYIPLNELFADGQSTVEQLEHLDRMCAKAEEEGLKDLRVKVHYFYHVPNHGLFVDLTQPQDGSFTIHTQNRPDAGRNGQAPLLELNRCKHCGEYLTVAEVDFTESTYRPLTMDDSDMFDLEEADNSRKPLLVFAMTNEPLKVGDNNAHIEIAGNKFSEVRSSERYADRWSIIANTQCSCPYCGTKLTKQKGESNPEIATTDEEDNKKLQKFRVSADFLARLIAPSTLDLMTPCQPKTPGRIVLHDGQQYISFVDSRQNAAQTTIRQNVEEERLWVYSRMFHDLMRRKATGGVDQEALKRLNEQLMAAVQSNDMTLMGALMQEKNNLLAHGQPYLTWENATRLLHDDPLMEVFCQQFAERSEQSVEVEAGKPTERTMRRYVHSILTEYMAKRPLSVASPETMGLFHTFYPKLEAALTDELPEAVQAFNRLLSEERKISKQDWHDLLAIFVDYTVRSNESVYLKIATDPEMDIFKCVRFATKKERRRPVRQPHIKERTANASRVVRLVAQLLAEENSQTIAEAIKRHGSDIENVLVALWTALTETYALLTRSTHYDEEQGQHKMDKDLVINDVRYPAYRLNLNDMAFKLYDEVWLCDTNTTKENDSHHVACLRPVETLFKGYSPYLIGSEPHKPGKEMHQKWEDLFPYYYGSGETASQEQILEWAKTHRSILCDNNLWGEQGVFADRLTSIYSYPKLFIQAEHTAQVDKMVSRQVQKDFKDHGLNILACSTTMEMGVDLGDLELVMMTSVPPHPSNYKQRAGRSGRRGQVRSAAVTLCGSDAIGMRTLLHPMENLICRVVENPTVDLQSAQVVQRHVDSFLIREFGVFNMSDHGGSISQKVIDYYTPFILDKQGPYQVVIRRKADNAPVGPADGLGDPSKTPYEEFNRLCAKPLTDEQKARLKTLLRGTIFDDKVQYVVDEAREKNEQCYAELGKRLNDLGMAFQQATSNKQKNFFMLKYIEPLASQLLTYWATHRFTPNANMPVNVVEFDVNSTNRTSYSMSTPSNPSYPLRTALAQYAPGNPIARDGIVRIVRGIRYTNFFNPTKTFKKLYRNDQQVVIDHKEDIDGLREWYVSGSTALELLQPTEFIPDMNESASRILDKNVFTRVNAQLIGAEEWKQDRTEPHLFDARSSRESGDSKILYYNEGVGFGYCHCTKCGRTVLEQWAANDAANPEQLPPDMNPIAPPEGDDRPYYHLSLIKKNGRAARCLGCNSIEHIRRNVVLGDTIQTDYTEVRIRHLFKDWINLRNGNDELLITLGVLFTQALAEHLNIERDDIDFTITPNGHICVFDTNPGGSGYANQLARMDILKSVVKKALAIIRVAEEAHSKDVLLYRHTLHLLDRINLDAAKAWIEEELSAQDTLPSAIETCFPAATETSLLQLERDFKASQQSSMLFVDDDYNTWDYFGEEHGWRAHLFNHFANRGTQTTLCVMEESDHKMEEPARAMVRALNGWMCPSVHMANPFLSEGIYPLAYIDGRLYFTNNPEHKSLNDKWGSGTTFYVQTTNPAVSAEAIDTSVPQNKSAVFKLTDGDPTTIRTSQLGKLIHDKTRAIVDTFISHCKAHSEEEIQVVYQDEHLKSILGMVLTLQTIGYFAEQMGNTFNLRFKVEQYADPNGKDDSITANLTYHGVRDSWLTSLTNSFLDDLWEEKKIDGQLEDSTSVTRRTLSHWRELSFECAGMKLSIYPDGGLLNGWKIASQPRYSTSEITHDTDISLFRNCEIKFDVVIED